MSDRHDYCDRCGNQPYYDGHETWCAEIIKLEDRIEELEHRYATLKAVVKGHIPDFQVRYAYEARVTQYERRDNEY